MRHKELFAFIKARHDIFMRRAAGKPKPWTNDPILQAYRFCNMYRELDTVTIWIREHWREPFTTDPNVWFAMVVARVVNWPESLQAITPAITNTKMGRIAWSPDTFVKKMDERKAAGEKVWTGAYMIHADAEPGLSKAAYYAKRVLDPVWKDRKDGHAAFTGSLSEAHRWLMQYRDMGSFMAAQVIADVKYTNLLKNAPDWWTWAAPGPGSLRGMSRVEFGDVSTKYTDEQWSDSLRELKAKIDPMLVKAGMSKMHAQDLQNCLCEADKYWRVKNGEGKPRSKYPGKD